MPPGERKSVPEPLKHSTAGVLEDVHKQEKVVQSKYLYGEIQRDELIALASIYGDDFRKVDSKHGAWKKSEPSFEVLIKSADNEMRITLTATLTATYPRTTPLLSLKNGHGLPDGTMFKAQKLIETKPKDLISEDQPIIMEIIQACQEILDEAADAKAAGLKLPSLEEERAANEVILHRAAEVVKKEEVKRKHLEHFEEERMLEALVEDEFKRQKARAKDTRRKANVTSSMPRSTTTSVTSPHAEVIIFDHSVGIRDFNGNSFRCQAFTGKSFLRKGPISSCFTVRPVTHDPTQDIPTILDSPILALKETEIVTTSKDQNTFKYKLQSLETDLEKLKAIRHQNILAFYDSKVQKSKSESAWTVSILTEIADKGSLEELLEMTNSLNVAKARSWTIDLLDALQFLHSKNIVHADIHPSNILLVRADGEVRPKLADTAYQKKIHQLSGTYAMSTMAMAKSAYWVPNEIAGQDEQAQLTTKTDVWDFGIVILKMLFGPDVVRKYISPRALSDNLPLSDSLYDLLVGKIFRSDPKRRPRAFDLRSSEFLATDAPVLEERDSSSFGPNLLELRAISGRKRRDSTVIGGPWSRYEEDFAEEGRLGKGGFGEVVKARKKLDGMIYAVKKITQKSSAFLDEILKEVQLLSQLSHPYIVRYINTWIEKIPETRQMEEDISTTTDTATTFSSDRIDFGGIDLKSDFADSNGEIDFMSTSGFQNNFEEEASSDSEETDEEESSDEARIISHASQEGEGPSRRRRSNVSRNFKTIMYIQMEYCEKRTLMDLIRRDLYKDSEESWRLIRQILEGLAYVHGRNVVHRDLKPANVFIDGASNVRIGDFGLATSGHHIGTETSASNPSIIQPNADLTRSIGTPFYHAPEMRSTSYTNKVDMYSLGMIFFEMNYRPLVGMEKAKIFEMLRQKIPQLPVDFGSDKALQGDIILSLLNHSVKDRPSSSELLHSGKLPVQLENETIRQTLANLSDPTSPYHTQVLSALFTRPVNQAKDLAWDMAISTSTENEYLLQGLVKQRLINIFRNHGAVETPRSALFPRSNHYGPNCIQLLDASGNSVQLAYDLTYPHARAVAKDHCISKSFAFGVVYRDTHSGAAPKAFGEVDFDIVSYNSLDLALKEAEVIKVLDEIILNLPLLSADKMFFQINHSNLLQIIFDFCRIEASIRRMTADTLSGLGIQKSNWQKIRSELRSPAVGVSATSVDDLQRFDFRDTPTNAFKRLKAIFESTEYYEKITPALAHLQDVIMYTKRFDIRTRIFVCPLASLKEKFCKDGLVFSCVYDKKSRDYFAAGGRYDSLIHERSLSGASNAQTLHAVGFNLAWEKLAWMPAKGTKNFLRKPEEELQGYWSTKRCDVLVASHDAAILRAGGIEVLQQLWQHDISAELAQDTEDARSLEEKYREDHHSWVVIVKQDSVKIKCAGQPDVEMPSSQLIVFLRGEIRERDQREGNLSRIKLSRHASQPDTGGSENGQDVRVLIMAGTKSKKSNRRNIVEQAQVRANALVQSFLDGPIAAIETTDYVLDQIRQTRLSDPESWRKVMQGVASSERRYMGEIHELVSELARENKASTRNAFIYNFRTGTCVYYDLQA